MNPTSTKFGVVTPSGGTSTGEGQPGSGNTIGGSASACNPPQTLKVVNGKVICYTLQCPPGSRRITGSDGRYMCFQETSCSPGQRVKVLANGTTTCVTDRISDVLANIMGVSSQDGGSPVAGIETSARGIMDFIAEHKLAVAAVAAGGIYLISKSGKKRR